MELLKNPDLAEVLIEHNSPVRLCAFLFFLILFTSLENIFPRRINTCRKLPRWLCNISLSAFNSIISRLFFPLLVINTSLFIEKNQLGLFNQINLNYELEFFISIIILDLVIFRQHKLFHRYKNLWKIHKIHHIDPDMDASSGVRFHPIEMTISLFVKVLTIATFGISTIAYLCFEILLNFSSLFEHSNIKIPRKIDKLLRYIIVTPDMHRIHHSIHINETHSNYGFNLSLWDRLFKTYTKYPKENHKTMTLGVEGYQNSNNADLIKIIAMPFYKEPR